MIITSSEPWDPKNKPLRVSAASLDYNHQQSHVAVDGIGSYTETMGNSNGNNGLMGNNCRNYYGSNAYGNDTGTNYGNNYGNITETNHGNHGNITETYGIYSNMCSGSGTSHVGCTVNVLGAMINGVCMNGGLDGSGFHVNEGNNQPRETDMIIGSMTPHLVESRFCSDVVESVKISSFQVNQHSSPTPETVSRLWNVGLETAQWTLRATTQQGIRSAVHPIFRRYQVDLLHFHRKRLHATFHTDTLFSKIILLLGNKCAQVFTNGAFTAVYPIMSKSHTGDSLWELINDVGIPDRLYADLAAEHTGTNTEFQQQVRKFHIQMHYAEKGRKNQNHRAEREIGILKT